MAITFIHHGHVEKGRFVPDNAQKWAVVYCGHEGKRVEVTVERERKAGSKKQQGYYFGVIIPILCEFGYEKDEAHWALKYEHLRIPRADGFPETVKKYRDLSTVEREAYHENCRRTLTRMGAYCPLPNEVMV
ncbi:conserved hypothetical protein [Gammaproteobacteria bacterium]